MPARARKAPRRRQCLRDPRPRRPMSMFVRCPTGLGAPRGGARRSGPGGARPPPQEAMSRSRPPA
eukprot:11171246-Lingulodinium_polyedra.AAC.1